MAIACACGCGERTTVRHGKARRFVHGHNGRLLRPGRRLDFVVTDCGYVTPCHIWKGRLSRDGYARRRDSQGKRVSLARLAWEAVNGPMPAGLVPDHLCRERGCIRPDHIEPVTHAENVRRGASTRLTRDEVRAIRRRCAAGEKQMHLAAEYGIRQGSVANIVARRSWADL